MVMDLGYFEDLEAGIASAKVVGIMTLLLSVFAGVLVW